MTTLLALLVLFDAALLPTTGVLTSLLFILITLLGLWRVRSHKSWFILSLIYISISTALYLLGGRFLDETVIHKLADWSFIFLIGGSIQLARNAR